METTPLTLAHSHDPEPPKLPPLPEAILFFAAPDTTHAIRAAFKLGQGVKP